MAELTASHGSSLKKRDAELVGLRAEIKAVRRELEGRNMELGEQEAAIRSSTATSRDVCDNLEGVTELLEWTRDALRQTVRAFGEWREERADLGKDEWEALQAQALEREYRIVALEGRLATSQRTASSLQADNLILRSSNELLRTQFDDLTHDLARMQGEIRWSNAVRHTEKDWRQRARADGRESHVLRHEVASLTSHLTSSLDYSHHLHLSSVATHAELQRDQELLQRELEIAEGELEEAMEVEIPALEDEVISLSNTLSIATLDESNLRSLLLEAEETLAELQITSKEETEGLSGELEECARMLSERESEVQKLKVDRIKASGNLGLHKAAEKALLQELARYVLSCLVRFTDVSLVHKLNSRRSIRQQRRTCICVSCTRRALDAWPWPRTRCSCWASATTRLSDTGTDDKRSGPSRDSERDSSKVDRYVVPLFVLARQC